MKSNKAQLTNACNQKFPKVHFTRESNHFLPI
uniref:Uncharacterized protein n=1 Tax=Siphoviridae sp. ctVOP12 TaxID=2825531 RepID=A0A8S5VA50_9CAUD|nr:MAG TPA: protein of unknown function DUF480 [Siphoviridae sp. ctVOP12]